MANEGWARDARRHEALTVLTTGVVGNPTLEHLTTSLIEQARGRPTPTFSFDAAEMSEVRHFVEQHRVAIPAARLVPDLREATVGRLANAMAIERHLLDATAILEAAGVPTRVLKGNATGRLDYPDPSDREVGDVDLLVQPDQLGRASVALEAAGYRNVPTHPFATPAFFHSETFLHADGTEIDLHHRFAQPSRTSTSCWAEPESFRLGGRTLLAMPRTWRFTHALVHQLKDAPPTVRAVNGLLDLVVMWTKGVVIDDVRRAASEINLVTLAERGLARVADLLDEERPDPPLSSPSAGWSERKLAAALDSDRPVPGYLSLAANLRVQPVRRWPSYVRQLVWPTESYREELGITAGGQTRHVLREMLGR